MSMYMSIHKHDTVEGLPGCPNEERNAPERFVENRCLGCLKMVRQMSRRGASDVEQTRQYPVSGSFIC